MTNGSVEDLFCGEFAARSAFVVGQFEPLGESREREARKLSLLCKLVTVAFLSCFTFPARLCVDCVGR